MLKKKTHTLGEVILRYGKDIFLPIVSQFIERYQRKLFLHFEKNVAIGFIPKQGELYFVELGVNIKDETNKTRPCYVASHQNFNKGGTVIVMPIKTYYGSLHSKFEVLVVPTKNNGLKKVSRIAVTQMKTVSKARIKGKIGVLEEVYAINTENIMKKMFLNSK